MVWLLEKMKVVLFKYLIIFFCLLIAWHNAISQVNIDSLKEVIPHLEGAKQLKAIQQLTFRLQYTDLEQYLEFSQHGFELALAHNDSSYVTIFLIDIGYYYKYKGNYRKALEEFKRAERIAFEKDYKSLLSFAYTALGSVYHDLSDYDKALDYHTRSFKIKEEQESNIGMGNSYNNIGLVYYKINDQERALEYFQKSIDFKLQAGDTSSTIVPYINIGLSYAEYALEDSTNSQKEKLKKANENFRKANVLAKKYHELYRIGYSYNGLARIHLYMQEYDSAFYYANLSLKESAENNYKLLESSNYYLLSKIAFDNGQFDLAIDELHKSHKLLTSHDDKHRKKINYELYAEIYEAKNQLDSAYSYQKKYSDVKDEIFNEELANNIANLQIANIEEENQKVIASKEDTINRGKSFNLFLLAILALSIALIIVIFRSYSQTSKINRQLKISQKKIEAQKENLEKKNSQLADAQITIRNQNEVLKNINVDLDKKVKERTAELNRSNVELEKAVKDLDQFIYKTSHDLRGPIATMQGIINLGVLDAIDDKSRDYFNTLHKVSTNLNNVLFRLIEVHETYQKKPVYEMLDPMQEILETTNRVSKFNVDPEINFITKLEANGQWNSDKVLFNLIIENMVRNAILYRDRGESIIKIKSEYKANNLFITIEDNGFGIQQGDEEKVFNIFFKGSPRPGGTGLEVYTSKIAVEKLGGTIILKKSMKNTIFEIVLPVIEN